MKTQRLYLNVYRSGHYHRQGKPNVTNLHAGDLYASPGQALEDAEEDNGYLFTVPVDVPVPNDATILANPPNSEPTPLSVTRRNPLTLLPWHTGPAGVPTAILTAGEACLMAGAESLEVGDDVLGMTYEEWRREREKVAPKPLPAAHRPVAALLAPPEDRHAAAKANAGY